MRKLVVLLFVLGLAGVSHADGPFTGTWKLNVAKSHFASSPTAPKEETVTVTDRAGTRDVVAEGADMSGKPISEHFRHSLSGGPVTLLEGGPTGITASVKLTAHTVHETFMRDGKELGTEDITVSRDGKTMRIMAKGTSPDGKPFSEIYVLEKQ